MTAEEQPAKRLDLAVQTRNFEIEPHAKPRPLVEPHARARRVLPDEAQSAATGKAAPAQPRTSAAERCAEDERRVGLDFMRDTLYGGKVFRTLNVIDEANRGGLGIDVAVSIPAVRVIAFVAQLIDLHGRPQAIRCDNGPELTSEAFTDWCKKADIELHFIQPGKPDQNAYIERFNRTYREEVAQCLLVRFARRGARAEPRNGSRSQTPRRAGKPAASALPRAPARRGNSSLKQRGSLRGSQNRERRFPT